MDRIDRAPRRMFEHLHDAAPCLGQIAFAGECPPRDDAAKSGEQAAGNAPLADALYCERCASDAEQPPRERSRLGTAVPTLTVPDAGRCAMSRRSGIQVGRV